MDEEESLHVLRLTIHELRVKMEAMQLVLSAMAVKADAGNEQLVRLLRQAEQDIRADLARQAETGKRNA